MCRRPDLGIWNLPGGGVESGETPWQAVVREVKEEVGLDVRVERLVGVYAKPNADEVVFSFGCRIVGGSPSLSEEADAIESFPVDALPPRTSPKHAERIRDASPGVLPLLKELGPSARTLVERGLL